MTDSNDHCRCVIDPPVRPGWTAAPDSLIPQDSLIVEGVSLGVVQGGERGQEERSFQLAR
jgi:hypothetical protein